MEISSGNTWKLYEALIMRC